MEDFAGYIQAECDRLAERRAAALEARAQADRDIDAIDNEFRAVQAYQAAKEGKPMRAISSNTTRRRGVGGAKKGSRREELLNLIISRPQGMKRGEILEALGLKGDKAAEMSVSNALTAMIKSNQLSRKDGNLYIAGTPSTAVAA